VPSSVSFQSSEGNGGLSGGSCDAEAAGRACGPDTQNILLEEATEDPALRGWIPVNGEKMGAVISWGETESQGKCQALGVLLGKVAVCIQRPVEVGD